MLRRAFPASDFSSRRTASQRRPTRVFRSAASAVLARPRRHSRGRRGSRCRQAGDCTMANPIPMLVTSEQNRAAAAGQRDAAFVIVGPGHGFCPADNHLVVAAGAAAAVVDRGEKKIEATAFENERRFDRVATGVHWVAGGCRRIWCRGISLAAGNRRELIRTFCDAQAVRGEPHEFQALPERSKSEAGGPLFIRDEIRIDGIPIGATRN